MLRCIAGGFKIEGSKLQIPAFGTESSTFNLQPSIFNLQLSTF